MNQHSFSWTLFARCPVVGIVRHLSAQEIDQILPIYVENGLTTLEFTLNTSGATAMIRDTRARFPNQLNVGAGTVRSRSDLEEALAAGAQFIVTPTLNESVVEACVAQGIPIFPGAFTPTEIERAWLLGASMVKVYPADILGPGYLRDVKAPLDDVKLLPTGGISLANAAAFRQAGADGLGVGSQLFDKELIRAHRWVELADHFRAFVAAAKV